MVENKDRLTSRVVVTIPVVVHIVWRSPEENLTDAQIQSQLEVLNRDFRAKNTEISTVPTIFKPAIADVEIEFCLARRTPDGRATTGITRTPTNVTNVATHFTPFIGEGLRTICYTDFGGQDAWDTKQYLNIWVGKFGANILGQADFPTIAKPAEDGIRLDPRAFGTINVNPPYHLGRTLTHEIGHYFNLFHPWGTMDENLTCTNDDGIADTPRQSATFRNQCPTHPQLLCGTASMFMNFMNYTNDACLAMFTKGQKERMLAALYGSRGGLLSSQACQPILTGTTQLFKDKRVQILGNPTAGQLSLQASADLQERVDLQLINSQGQIVVQDRWHTSTIYTKSVSTFSPGIYFLILKNDYFYLYEKIVISR